MLYELTFKSEHGETVIHVGTHAQCQKTIATYIGAYDLLKDHSLITGSQLEALKQSFYLNEYLSK